MTPELTDCEVCGMRWTARRHELCPRCLLADIREDAMKGWAQARGATEARDALQVNYNNLEKERVADEARAQETISAVRKRAEHAERERDEAREGSVGCCPRKVWGDGEHDFNCQVAELERDLASAIARAEKAEAEVTRQQTFWKSIRDARVAVSEAHVAKLEEEREKDKRTIDELVAAERAVDDALEASKARVAELEKERDEAKNLLAAANERAERAEEVAHQWQKGREKWSATAVALAVELDRERINRDLELRNTESALTSVKGLLQSSESLCKEFEGALKEIADWKPQDRVDVLAIREYARAALAQQGHANKLPTGDIPEEGRREGEHGKRDARLAAADAGGSTGEVIAGSADPQRTAAISGSSRPDPCRKDPQMLCPVVGRVADCSSECPYHDVVGPARGAPSACTKCGHEEIHHDSPVANGRCEGNLIGVVAPATPRSPPLPGRRRTVGKLKKTPPDPDPIRFVRCPECDREQADMGRNVRCEECGYGPMPYRPPDDNLPPERARPVSGENDHE